MKKLFGFGITGMVAAAVMTLSAPVAMAHGQVNWSINVGTPVYAAAPVYIQPQPVYFRPQPVYVQPAIVEYRQPYYSPYPQPYYVQEVKYKKLKHKHGKHHHRDDD